MSCKKAQEFLAQNKIEDGKVQSASKEAGEGKAALKLLAGINELLVAKGKNTMRYDLKKERPSDDELLEVLLGRSGKLRAPAMRIGKKFLVGYNSEILDNEL